MLTNDEIKRVAEECGAYVWKENIEVQATAISYYAAGDAMFSENQLLAFAQHIYKKAQDEQREKDAQICEDTDDEYFCGELRKTQYVCADAIRNASPESDGCEIVEYSSRMCERGTKSCVKKHAHAESDIDQATRTE